VLAKHTGVPLPGAAKLPESFPVTSAQPASRELIDDPTLRRYDLMRVVEIPSGYECVRFTQVSLLGACRPVPVVAHGGGHGLRRVAQRGRSVGERI
jgi:hypothetical protein